MFVLRCTQKLLTRLHAVPVANSARTDTVLGDWYANLIRVGRLQLVLAVSERTLLPVLVPARDGRTLLPRLVDALEPVLLAIGIAAEDVAAERCTMQSALLGKTANRRVLGSMNDLAFQVEGALLDWPHRPLLEHSLWLARTPMSMLEHGAPDQATVAAFEAERALRRIRRG